ncbi:hypothetical protein [uncultured Salinicola sp.]|uniref:hypothetical protein n=1 Tax=uncultured Salinicola sp. TaxID=1193542 RepID=UPI002636FC36|nr:hypothetical protein [uncultured Salinicola sp.]
MGIFSKKDTGKSRSKGLGRSVSSAGDDGDIVMDREFDAFDDDLPSDDGDKGTGLSDEIMEIDRADRSDIDAALEAAEPKKKKSKGLFGRKKAAKTDDDLPWEAADDSKPEKAKPEKKRKLSRKAAKELKEQEDAKELTTRLSVLVEIEELPGVTKEDAIETARHQALNHSDRPSNCYFSVLQTRKGFLIEVQEGVGRSYLPSVHKLAMDNPGRIVVVPMVRRKLTVIYSPRTDSFDTQILGEDIEPPVINGEPPLDALRGGAMTPVFKQYQQWFMTGVITAAIGGIALISSLAFYAFDPGTQVPPDWKTTSVTQLPVMQWSSLQSDRPNQFVARLEYSDSDGWRTVYQSNYADVQVNAVTPGDDGAIVGGEVQGPATPDALAPGATPLPSAPAPLPAPAGSPPPPAGMTNP